MANTMVKIDVHLVFHIKSTSVQMHPTDLPRIFEYIGGTLKELGCIPIIVGGVSDHIHILTSIAKTITLSGMMRAIKAGSSKWIKSLSSAYATFAWQDGYGAFSVSPSIRDKVVDYIRNQARHHQRISFADEYKALLDAYQIPYDEKFLFND